MAGHQDRLGRPFARIRVQGFLDDFLFGQDGLNYPGVDAASDNQVFDEHVIPLPDAMDAIGGLFHLGR